MPQFDPTYFVSQIFWLILCLLVLGAVMMYGAIPRIQGTMSQRAEYLQDIRDRHASYLKDVEDLTSRMNALKQQHEETVKKILVDAHAKALHEKEEALAHMNAQFTRAHNANMESLHRDIAKIKQQIPDMAQTLGSYFLEQFLEKNALSSSPEPHD